MYKGKSVKLCVCVQGQDMLDNVVNITRLDHPGVKTTCVFGTGVDTPRGILTAFQLNMRKNILNFFSSS